MTGGDEASLFVCAGCGRVYEVGENGLGQFPAQTAAVTTELAVAGPVAYLAVWRLCPQAGPEEDSVWERICQVAAPRPACLYVPAFSLVRPVVQRIGVGLTEMQPVLELAEGGPAGLGRRPTLVDAGMRGGASGAGTVELFPGSVGGPDPAALGAGRSAQEVDWDAVSPILIGPREAWGLAHFVHLAVEVREGRDLSAVDLRLAEGAEELLFLPAVWDPRYIHESNWRLLLREFDGLVA